MKINKNTKVIGKNVILVPYRECHVSNPAYLADHFVGARHVSEHIRNVSETYWAPPKISARYHKWMTSNDLLELTCSEPLSLEEEYEMQIRWMEDEDKCTFIVLDKAVNKVANDEVASMIGDTNIFILEKSDDSTRGEIEIMIAEESARGKKIGWEAVILMMLYGIKYLNLHIYEAKILLKNETSIKMFEKLQFEKSSTSTIFQEVTMQKNVTSDWVEWLEQQYELQITEY